MADTLTIRVQGDPEGGYLAEAHDGDKLVTHSSEQPTILDALSAALHEWFGHDPTAEYGDGQTSTESGNGAALAPPVPAAPDHPEMSLDPPAVQPGDPGPQVVANDQGQHSAS
jgi:hypothetical protein